MPFFGKDAIRKYKSLVGFSQRKNVKLGIYDPVQWLDALIFNRNDHKPHVFLIIGSICKECEMNGLIEQHPSNQLCHIEFSI